MLKRIITIGICFITLLIGVAATRPALAVSPNGSPVHIDIPSIKVHAGIESLGVTNKGVMLSPKSAWTVGWYNRGPKPGQTGNVVMYGHLNTTYSKTAVFTNLKKVRVGDTIDVRDDRGTLWRYRITEVVVYKLNAVPMAKLAGPTREKHLNMYTCAGTWDRKAQNYTHRLVIYSTLVGSVPPAVK